MEKTAKLITFGNGGHTIHFGGGATLDGYNRPADTLTPGESYSIPNNTPILDKTPALETTEGFAWVFKGPMVNVDLEGNAIDRCPVPSSLMASGVEGTYANLLALQAAHTVIRPVQAGPLDKVSIAEYIRGWREHGARYGVYFDGAIIWEKQ